MRLQFPGDPGCPPLALPAPVLAKSDPLARCPALLEVGEFFQSTLSLGVYPSSALFKCPALVGPEAWSLALVTSVPKLPILQSPAT